MMAYLSVSRPEAMHSTKIFREPFEPNREIKQYFENVHLKKICFQGTLVLRG